MTSQKPSPIYDDASPLCLSPSSQVRQEEAVVAKKKTLLGTALAVGVAVGLLLLVVAGDYYSIGVAPVASAHGGSTETIVDLLVEVDKPFATCSTPEGTFNGWSCDNKHGSYRDGCIDNLGQFKTKDKDRAFETCFGLGSPEGSRCWSKSHYMYSAAYVRGWFPCVPRDLGVHGNPPEHWYVAQPAPDGSCGEPCHYGFNEARQYPRHNIDDDCDYDYE